MGKATESWWQTPPHMQVTDAALLRVFRGDCKRLMINEPYQHGKSEHVTKKFPCWYLLLNPEARIVIIGHEYNFAVTQYGLHIQDLFNRWGPPLGLEIREDVRAKGTWQVAGHRGSVICRGWQGGVAGLPADLFIIDDLVKNAEQAMSEAISEAHWRFFMTVVFGRVQRTESRLVVVGTRWTKRDLFGRLLDMARRTGEQWEHLKFKALATPNDNLGRQEGQPLWPEQVSLDKLLAAKQEMGRWWQAGWQQEPTDEEGAFFKPSKWPSFGDVGGAFTLLQPGGGRQLLGYQDTLRFVCVDWATSERKHADFTAIGVFALCPDGRLLVLSMTNERIALEQVVATLAGVCRTWQPAFTVVESGGFQTALAIECRRYLDIPECRQVKAQGRSKLQRALPAIVMAENGRILLPDPVHCAPVGLIQDSGWLDSYRIQMTEFTGLDDGGHDDMVDVTAYAAQQAQLLRGGSLPLLAGNEPCLLTAGKDTGGW